MKYLKKYFQHIIDRAVQDEAFNIISLAERNTKAKVVDLGTGPAIYFKNSLLKAKEKIASDDIVATDISPSFIREAKEFGLKAAVCDLTKSLPFKSNTFDVVLSNQVIEHLFDVDLFVSEIFRILKSGGYAIMGTENLAAWYNIFPLLFGYQPFIATTISFKGVIGNPFSLHKNDSMWNGREKRWMSHCKLFSYQAFVDIFKIHGFKIEKVLGAGYYPLPNFLGKIMAKLDVRHSCRMQIKVRKALKK